MQEESQSYARTDGDRRTFHHGNIRQYGTYGSTKKKAHLDLPDKKYQHDVFHTGQCAQHNKDEASKGAEQLRRGQRKKKSTTKGSEYKTFLMKERRDKLYARFIRKCAVIEDLFHSSRNITAVQENVSV